MVVVSYMRTTGASNYQCDVAVSLFDQVLGTGADLKVTDEYLQTRLFHLEY